MDKAMKEKIKKDKLLILEKKIKKSLTTGKFMDDYIAGKIVTHIKPAEKKEKLIEKEFCRRGTLP